MTEPTLIIDDDATFNAVLVRTLERRGHPARGAADPVAALTVANEFRPARVVLRSSQLELAEFPRSFPQTSLVCCSRIVMSMA